MERMLNNQRAGFVSKTDIQLLLVRRKRKREREKEREAGKRMRK